MAFIPNESNTPIPLAKGVSKPNLSASLGKKDIKSPAKPVKAIAPVVAYVDKVLKAKKAFSGYTQPGSSPIMTLSETDAILAPTGNKAYTLAEGLKKGQQLFVDLETGVISTNNKKGKPLFFTRSEDGKDVSIDFKGSDPLLYFPEMNQLLDYVVTVTNPDLANQQTTASLMDKANQAKNATNVGGFLMEPDSEGAESLYGSPFASKEGALNLKNIYTPDEYEALNRKKGSKPGEFTVYVTMLDGSVQPLISSATPTTKWDKFLYGLDAWTSQPLMQTWSRVAKSNPVANLGIRVADAIIGGTRSLLTQVWYGMAGLPIHTLQHLYKAATNQAEWSTFIDQEKQWVQKNILMRYTNGVKSIGSAFNRLANSGDEELSPIGTVEWASAYRLPPNFSLDGTMYMPPTGPAAKLVQDWETEKWAQFETSQINETELLAQSEAVWNQAKTLIDVTNSSPQVDLNNYTLIREYVTKAIDLDERLGYSTNHLGYANFNPWYFFDWDLNPEAYKAFKTACVDTAIQNLTAGRGPHLSEIDIKRIGGMFADPLTEMMGAIAADFTNFIPFGVIIGGITKGISTGIRTAIRGTRAIRVAKASMNVFDAMSVAGKTIDEIDTPAARAVFNLDIERELYNLAPDLGKWALRQSARSASLTYQAMAGEFFRSLARGTSNTNDFLDLVDDTAEMVMELHANPDKAVEIYANLPQTVGRRQFAEAIELSKIIPPEEWSKRALNSVQGAIDEVTKAKTEEALRLWAIKDGKKVTELAPEIIAGIKMDATAAATRLVTPKLLATSFSDDFRKVFIQSKRVFANSPILNDGMIGWLAAKFPMMQSNTLGKIIQGAANVTNWVMGAWYTAVLSARPAWVIRNFQDNTARFLLVGGKFGKSLREITLDLNEIPDALIQSMSRLSEANPKSLKFRLDTGWLPRNLTDFYRYQFKDLYSKYNKPAFGTSETGVKAKLTTLFKDVIHGADFYGGNFFRAFTRGTGDWNNFVEYSFRIRLYHQQYMKGLEEIRPQLMKNILGTLSPELRPIAEAIIEKSNFDPIKLAEFARRGIGTGKVASLEELGKLREAVHYSSYIPGDVRAIFGTMSPEERSMMNVIRRRIEDFVESIHHDFNREPEPAEIKTFMAGIRKDVDDMRHQVSAVHAEMVENMGFDASARNADALDGIMDEVEETVKTVRPNTEAFDLYQRVLKVDTDITKEEFIQVLKANKVETSGLKTQHEARAAFVGWMKDKLKVGKSVGGKDVIATEVKMIFSEDSGDFISDSLRHAIETRQNLSAEHKAAILSRVEARRKFRVEFDSSDVAPEIKEWAQVINREMDLATYRTQQIYVHVYDWVNATDPSTRRAMWSRYERSMIFARQAQEDVFTMLEEAVKQGKIIDTFDWIEDYYKAAGFEFKFDDAGMLSEIKFTIPDEFGVTARPVSSKNRTLMNYYRSVLEVNKVGLSDKEAITTFVGRTADEMKKMFNIPEKIYVGGPRKVSTAEVLGNKEVMDAYGTDYRGAVQKVAHLYDMDKQYAKDFTAPSLARMLNRHLDTLPGDNLKLAGKDRSSLTKTIDNLVSNGYFSSKENFSQFVTDSIGEYIDGNYLKDVNAIAKKVKEGRLQNWLDMGLPEDEAAAEAAVDALLAEKWAEDTGHSVEEYYLNELVLLRKDVSDNLTIGNELFFDKKTGNPIWFNPLEIAIKDNLKDARYRSGMDVLKVLDGKPGVKSDAVEVSGLREWLMNITEKDLKGGFELENGKVINSLTPQDVLDYVNNHSLYMKEKNAVGQNLQFSGYSLTNPAEAGIGDPNTYFEYQFILPDYPKTGSHLDDNNVAWVRGFELDVDDWGHDARALHLDEKQSDIHERARDNLKHIRWGLFKKHSTIEPGTKGFTENSVAAYKATLNKFLQSSEEVDNLIAQNLSFTDRELEAMANAGTIWSHPRIQQNIGSYSTVVERVGDTFPLDDLKQSAQKFLDELAWAEESTLDAARRSVPDISDPNAMKWLENQVDIDEMGLLKSGGYEVEGFTLGAKLEPNYPFKKTYPELAMKRMIRKAVDDGLDGMTWTTGAQQVSRYGDIKVSWEQVGENKWKIFLGGKHEGQSLGRELGEISSFEDIRNLNAQELSNSWAETLWKKIKGTEVPELTGEVHSYMPMQEGMENYYDKWMTEYLNKLGKKYGGVVEDVKLAKSKVTIQGYTGHFMLYENGKQVDGVLYDTYEMAKEAIIRDHGIKVHGFKFTDEFKKWAGEAKPLYFKDSDGTRMAATTFTKQNRQVIFAYKGKDFNAVLAAHERAHGLLRNLTADQWDVTSKWMSEQGDRAVNITGDQFNSFHARKYLGQGTPLTKKEDDLYTAAQELFADGFVSAVRSGFTDVTGKIKEVFIRIAKFLQRYWDEYIAGGGHEVEVSGEMRRVYESIFQTLPKDIPEVINVTPDMTALWDTYKQARNLSQWSTWDLTTPNSAIASAKAMMDTARFQDDILTATETYNKLLSDLQSLEHWVAKMTNQPTKTLKHYVPIPESKLPIEFQNWAKARVDSLQFMQKTQKALIKWSDWLEDMAGKAAKGDTEAWFMQQQPPEFWNTITPWADKAAKEMQDAINAVMYGGTYDGTSMRGALPFVNDTMLDYTFSKAWENPMRVIFPFWMFPSRSSIFWSKMLAEHPQIAAWYQKYMLLSQRQQYQEGLVTSSGTPLPSYRGYIKIPGTDIWVNPLAAMSFRYVLNPLLGLESTNSSTSIDESADEAGPLVTAARSIMEVGRDFGFSPNPFLMMIPKVKELTGQESMAPQTLIPAMDLLPMNWRKSTLEWLGLMSSPTLKDAIAAEVPWKDYLVEVAALKDLNMKLMERTGDPDRQWQLVLAYQEMLSPSKKFDNNGKEVRQTREENPLWIKYRTQVENSALGQKWVAYFSGVFGKVSTDADAAFMELRTQRNLQRAMINNNVGADIFDLDMDAVDRYDDYINGAYNDPSGVAYNMAQAVRFVEDADGKEITDQDERRQAIVERIHKDVVNDDYYKLIGKARELRQYKLSQLPIGAPKKMTDPINQEYYDTIDAIETNPMYADREEISWSPVNKPEEKMYDHFRYEWFRDINAGFKPYNPDEETKPEYYARKEEWEANLTSTAAKLAPQFQKRVEAEMLKIFPLLGWGKYIDNVPGSGVPEAIVAKLMSETSVEGIAAYYRKGATLDMAIDQVWYDLYYLPRSDSVDGLSGDAYTKALNDFDYQFPVSALTPKMIADQINSYPEWKGNWTDDEVTRAYLSVKPMTAEEHQEAGKTDTENQVGLAKDIYFWVNPGTARNDFLDEVERIGGSDVMDTFSLLMTAGGSEFLALPKNSEQVDALVKALKQAATNKGITAPTGAQLDLRIQATSENDLMKEKAMQTLGPTIFEDMGEYYGSSYANQAEYRKQYPEKYAAIKKYPPFKDMFGKMYPVWKMFYDPDTKKTSTGGSYSGGSSSGGSSGGSNGYSSKSTAGLTVTGGSSLDLSYKLRDDFIQMGKRSTLFSNQLLSGSRLGSGGVAGKPTWPKELMDALGDLMMAEFIRSIEAQQPLSQAAVNYLSKLRINHPEWSEYIDELNKMVKEAQSSTQ